jgi:regulator of CtrA degradation
MMHQNTGAFASSWRAEVILDFARSELFERTFHEGMELVEETAAYLDGEGRQESKLLSRNDALAYAAESMRLTTRLMQVASWLLVQRAVREGEMRPEAASEDRYRLQGQHVRVLHPRTDLPAALALLSASATSTSGCMWKAPRCRSPPTPCCRTSTACAPPSAKQAKAPRADPRRFEFL